MYWKLLQAVSVYSKKIVTLKKAVIGFQKVINKNFTLSEQRRVENLYTNKNKYKILIFSLYNWKALGRMKILTNNHRFWDWFCDSIPIQTFINVSLSFLKTK